ncbi:MAG: preprotein translocase subunit YajC [Planctomycetes bacterium RIFCSPHIGHO2_02_FULL_38_41]|nr:MAG: preprotein translocase subunit YajC [Planctomycetes bacterium RIFCSPHIGHO2_02_FULL_38_41]OHB98555.1 MAG: preprotein translocase subunit YajC [Planctomycetes bacterium RIFCSPLOWO2_12_38_17]OHB99342.1 MAG: preprotein translocase subunit YajC [Planctomycetes bacterium RIFCSPHIGHO2_12_39_6]
MLFLLQAAAGKQSSTGMLTMLLPFILMFVVMYFLILRPQKKKEKDRKAMISRIRKNDRVVTAGGVHGSIVTVREHEVILRVDDAKDVKVKVDRSSIVSVLEVSHDEDEEEAKEIDKESGKETK